MDHVTLQNFRCFRDRQVARLAPLTLLVGENSTGKTSFMAMMRMLWDVFYRNQIPDFKEAPYDLGSFDEMAHHRGRGGGRAEEFQAGFEAFPPDLAGKVSNESDKCTFSVTFKREGTVPVPSARRIAQKDLWIEQHFHAGKKSKLRFGTKKGSWEYGLPVESIDLAQNVMQPFIQSFIHFGMVESAQESIALSGRPTKITKQDKDRIERFAWQLIYHEQSRPYASAPVRSKPHRTYDPARLSPDPEGDYVPMYLADLYFRNRKAWDSLKKNIEDFGQAAGLFDEISIKLLGKKESSPFQVEIRKYGGNLKGPNRNLLDVGYGISQVLPVVTELLRQNAPPIFLLQQPEVHLHPSAQAALGSLFCQVAAPNRQLVVETHSDNILDRIRMDVRDGKGKLKPEDVSILFFERYGLDVQIHSLRLDKQGNVLDAPLSYRRFFMEEEEKSLGM